MLAQRRNTVYDEGVEAHFVAGLAGSDGARSREWTKS